MRNQLRKFVGQTPTQPHYNQSKYQQAELFVVQNQRHFFRVETNVRECDHVESQSCECDDQDGHEPMEQDGNSPVAMFGVLKPGYLWCPRPKRHAGVRLEK